MFWGTLKGVAMFWELINRFSCMRITYLFNKNLIRTILQELQILGFVAQESLNLELT